MPTTSPVPNDRQIAEAFASARIFFGHQSVGGNILRGVEAWQKEHRDLAAVRVFEFQPGQALEAAGLYHARIGKNRDIPSKFAAFEDILVRQGYGQKFDVALMKLCYVDIIATTNVDEVFGAYRGTIDRIRQQCPNLRLLHCTVPLTVHTTGLKSMLKNWIKGDLQNASRAKFNEAIRQYSPDVFDIAAAEATRPDGSTESFSHEGAKCQAAAPCYTEGVGHLNDRGAKHVARVFLSDVGRMAQKTPPQSERAA